MESDFGGFRYGRKSWGYVWDCFGTVPVAPLGAPKTRNRNRYGTSENGMSLHDSQPARTPTFDGVMILMQKQVQPVKAEEKTLNKIPGAFIHDSFDENSKAVLANMRFLPE